MTRNDPGEPFAPWKIYLNLYARNIAANLLGMVIILLLIVFTPFSFFNFREIHLISEGDWQFLLMLFPFLLVIVAFFQYWFQCPICSFLQAQKTGVSCDRYSDEMIRRRTLNLPLILAMINAAVYFVAPILIIAAARSFELLPLDLPSARLFFFRTVMIGLITSCLCFFIVEGYCRRVLIPMVFPEGGLSRVSGAIRVSVLRRIRIFYLAGTLTPMIILVATLFFVTRDVVSNPQIPDQPVTDIFHFTLIVCIIFVIIGFRLNTLVGDSIVRPLEFMLEIVNKVEKGDFTQQITVVSNDEIGVLSEAGNRMIRGLAERERVRELFGKYITPQIRDKIISGEIPLDGERTVATVLFSDLRDFSRFVENHSPEEVILSMREYFTAMEETIRSHGGLILQYVGDEIEAVFGVPIETDDHADRAVRASLDMRRRLEVLNRNRRASGKPEFVHGVGICSGSVLAGNTGSKNHPSYTLIGETVNKASRIQELTKELGCDILICRKTYDLSKHSYKLEEKGSCFIKGHNLPVAVLEVI